MYLMDECGYLCTFFMIITKAVLTVRGTNGNLFVVLGSGDAMNTSSAPRSSSVRPLEKSTSAFWEMSPPALTIHREKKHLHPFQISVNCICTCINPFVFLQRYYMVSDEN